MNIATAVLLHCAGTSEGAEKGWDTRGRFGKSKGQTMQQVAQRYGYSSVGEKERGDNVFKNKSGDSLKLGQSGFSHIMSDKFVERDGGPGGMGSGHNADHLEERLSDVHGKRQ